MLSASDTTMQSAVTLQPASLCGACSCCSLSLCLTSQTQQPCLLQHHLCNSSTPVFMLILSCQYNIADAVQLADCSSQSDTPAVLRSTIATLQHKIPLQAKTCPSFPAVTTCSSTSPMTFWQTLQAQTLAEIAIEAREKAEKARQRVSEAESEVQAATVVKQKLQEDIDRLRNLATSLPPDADQQQAMQNGQTLDLPESGQTTEPDINTELKSKLKQLTDVTRTLDECEARVSLFGHLCFVSEPHIRYLACLMCIFILDRPQCCARMSQQAKILILAHHHAHSVTIVFN